MEERITITFTWPAETTTNKNTRLTYKKIPSKLELNPRKIRSVSKDWLKNSSDSKKLSKFEKCDQPKTANRFQKSNQPKVNQPVRKDQAWDVFMWRLKDSTCWETSSKQKHLTNLQRTVLETQKPRTWLASKVFLNPKRSTNPKSPSSLEKSNSSKSSTDSARFISSKGPKLVLNVWMSKSLS